MLASVTFSVKQSLGLDSTVFLDRGAVDSRAGLGISSTVLTTFPSFSAISSSTDMVISSAEGDSAGFSSYGTKLIVSEYGTRGIFAGFAVTTTGEGGGGRVTIGAASIGSCDFFKIDFNGGPL